MFLCQPNFFRQLAKHSLFWAFAMLDAALRKLPGILTDAFAPENFIARITDDDAHVRPVTVFVDHGRLEKLHN
jgi:hypothetical protein